MKTTIPILSILGIIVLMAACKVEKDDYYSPETGYDYYPLEVGKYIIYEVDSTVFDPNGDSLVYQTKTYVKEEVVDTLEDNAGNTQYKIERYERSADTLPWQVTKVLTAFEGDDKATRTEDNLRFINLTFPVREDEIWNGNAYFDPGFIVIVAGETIEMFKGWSSKILEVGQPDTIGGLQFQKVATVMQADYENLIEIRRSTEKYAKGVGLVYRELWILDTQCIEACDGQTWEEKAEKGFILRQKVISYN